MFNKALQIIAKTFTSPSNIRPALAGILFRGEKIIATNSFKLIEVTRKDFDRSELPTSTDFKFLEDKDIDFIVPNKTILDIKFGTSRSLPILRNAYFGNKKKHGDMETVGIMTNDLEREVITQTRLIDGKFPEYEQWFNQEKNPTRVGLGVNELLETCQALQKLGHRNLVLNIDDPLKPVIIETDETSEFKTRAIIMPLKI